MMKYKPDNEEIAFTGNEDSVKISTVVFFVLGLIIPFWLVTLPVCWYISYRTFKSGDGTPISKSGSTQRSRQNSSSRTRYEDLEQLKKLLDSGVLTEDEFNKEKSKILGS